MTAYTFETIGAAEALAYHAAFDSLVFTTPGSSAGLIHVIFDRFTARFAVTSTITGRTVIFGQNFKFETVSFPDGTTAIVGLLDGTPNGEAMYDIAEAGELRGGDGADTLVGGFGFDNLDGGGGADLYIIHPGDSPAQDAVFGGRRDTIIWNPADRLSFGALAVTSANYREIQAETFQAGFLAANELIATGAVDVVAVQFGISVLVFADTLQNNGEADEMVLLGTPGAPVTINLDQIQAASFVTMPARPAFALPAADPAPPPQPAASPLTGNGLISGDMDGVHISNLLGTDIADATATVLSLQGARASLRLTGTGFTYNASSQLTGGAATGLGYEETFAPGVRFTANLSFAGVSAAPFGQWVTADANEAAFSTLLAGNDMLQGSLARDVIRGYGGHDVIGGRGGADLIFGGDGNDQIFAGDIPGASAAQGLTQPSYLRGDAGDDYIVGVAGFDDINGNAGNDTVLGGAGADWAVGGKDNDRLFGEAGDDIVYGNLGEDTCVGGDGADLVRGGQQNDVLYGGAGNDWLSGDRDADTITGGGGADVFHTFGEAGIDRVTDFNRSEGDRVLLDPGTVYQTAQSGADVVITMTGGGQMILVGVQLSSLTGDWIST